MQFQGNFDPRARSIFDVILFLSLSSLALEKQRETTFPASAYVRSEKLPGRGKFRKESAGGDNNKLRSKGLTIESAPAVPPVMQQQQRARAESATAALAIVVYSDAPDANVK